MPKVLIDGNLVEVPATAVFADDGTTPFGVPTPPPGQTFTAEDIARVRQEEKDKLYSRLDESKEELARLRDQVGSLTAAEQRRAAELQAEQERLQAEARAKEEEELDAKSLIARREQEWNERLNGMERTWEQKLEDERKQREASETLLQKEREFNDLRDYAQSVVTANEDKIAPQLRPWITGNTREEIDAAVQRAIQTTDEIAADMQGLVPAGDPTQQAFVPGAPVAPAPPVTPGTRVTAAPGADPAAQFQTLSAEQIANMPMDQYAALRKQMGIGGQSNNRGLFG